MFFGVKSNYASVRFRRNYKLPAVEVIAPKISCFREDTVDNTKADPEKPQWHIFGEIEISSY